MKKKFFIFLKLVLLPAVIIACGLSFKTVSATAASRVSIINDLFIDYIYDLCDDDGKLYIPLNETSVYSSYGERNDVYYRLESSDISVVETVGYGRLIGKKRGTATLTLKEYVDGKYHIMHQIQVVVGQPKFYTREYNIGLGENLPIPDDEDYILGMQTDKKYTYAYRPHDTSILKKIDTRKFDGKKYDIYEAVNFGTTRVDLIEIYNGKERVCDTFTVNVRLPELGGLREIVYRKPYAKDFWKVINTSYDIILIGEKEKFGFEKIYVSDDPSIIYKNPGEDFQLVGYGTTNLHVYCKIKGKKYSIGTVKVTIVP